MLCSDSDLIWQNISTQHAQAYGTPELQAHATEEVMALLPQSLCCSLLLGLELAVQLLLAPLLIRQKRMAPPHARPSAAFTPSSQSQPQQQQQQQQVRCH